MITVYSDSERLSKEGGREIRTPWGQIYTHVYGLFDSLPSLETLAIGVFGPWFAKFKCSEE